MIPSGEARSAPWDFTPSVTGGLGRVQGATSNRAALLSPVDCFPPPSCCIGLAATSTKPAFLACALRMYHFVMLFRVVPSKGG